MDHAMDDKLELKLISQLMDQLQGEMQYGEDDFSSRLGRKKPGVEVVKIEGDMMPKKSMEGMEEMSDHDMDEDMEMGKDSPEDELKKRLMKMRG